MIARTALLASLKSALARSPAVALLGPRQSGKTTLARMLVSPDAENYFDLESPDSLRRLDDPETALGPLRDLVVIDEVQRRPELFPILRVLIDRPRSKLKLLLLGSASPALLRQASESLAGRLEIIQTAGFTAPEIDAGKLERLWLRGGFPRAFLASNEERSFAWRRQFARTFLEQDIPQLGVRIPAPQLERFWTMLAHVHGGIWNAAELASSLGISQPTVRSYLDLLTSAYMLRQLQPWHENLGKRQVKSPKVYFRDPGLLHALLGIRTRVELLSNPKIGTSWEGFIIEQLLAKFAPDSAYFWATHQGAELDLLMLRGARRIGVEIKRSDAPAKTKSMEIAMADLKLNRLWVIYPGKRHYSLSDKIHAMPVDIALAMSDRDMFALPVRPRRSL
jgi:predicted AAA+ superfamily ATPase